MTNEEYAAVQRAMNTLTNASTKFRQYARHHREKVMSDEVKAKQNDFMAQQCEQTATRLTEVFSTQPVERSRRDVAILARHGAIGEVLTLLDTRAAQAFNTRNDSVACALRDMADFIKDWRTEEQASGVVTQKKPEGF